MMRRTGESLARFHTSLTRVACILVMLLSLWLFSAQHHAQAIDAITPSGLNTEVTLSPIPPAGQIQYDITGGTRPGGGTNLFHSFGDFGIPPNNIANFLNNTALPTSNILARVTGNIRSDISGTIQTTGFGNASLFLINPAGFLFGPNANVNVGGMVTFTSANYLRLIDGVLFNKTPDIAQDALLSASPVAAFGFIGSTHAIDFKGGQLTIANGTGVTLVGGDINLVPDSFSTPSTITAPGRQIRLTSVAAGPGEVSADTAVPIRGMALGTITLDQDTVLSTVGDSSFMDGGGGSVSIRGGQFVAVGASIVTSPAEGSAGSGGVVTIAVSDSATLSEASVLTNSLLAGGAGAVSITADTSLAITNTTIDSTTVLALGDSGAVTLTTTGPLSVTDSTINTRSDLSGNGGAVTVTGMDVILERVRVITDVFSIPGLGPDLVRPGAVTVTAQDTVTISGLHADDTIITATAEATLLDAGSVTITGKTVNLSNGKVDASIFDGGIVSPGNGGAIEIHGNTNLNQFVLTSANSGSEESTGAGGNIRLVDADNTQLTASRLNASATSGGGGGNIELQSKLLTVSDHTDVATGSFGQGSGGTITVSGAEDVTIESGSRFLTDVVVSLVGVPQGKAGEILIETQNLTLQGGGHIRAGALPLSTGNAANVTVQGRSSPAESVIVDGLGSGIFTDTQGTGAGGDIFVNANTVTLQNAGTLSAKTSGTEATATGGSIRVDATDQVTMTGGASITASSTGPGNAGDISINAGQQFDMQSSSVTAKATQASGGNIDIRAVDRVRLINSEISSSVQGGASTAGGNITIDPNVIVLQDSSNVTATAIRGAGGSITLTTPLFLKDSSSQVSASSEFGLNGTVTIQSPTSNLSGSLGPLTSTPSQAQALLTQRCAALANVQASSFVVAGREQLPSDPGGWLTSPLAFAALGESFDASNAVASAPATMPIAGHDIGTVSLRRLTPTGFLMASFADSAATGCHS